MNPLYFKFDKLNCTL